MLQLALEMDRRIFRDVDCRSAAAQLRGSGRFDVRMLNAIESYSPAKMEFDARLLLVRQLRSGMVLDEDVVSKDGNVLILKEGTALTQTWIERVENFSKTRGAPERIRVRIPRLAGMGQFSRPVYGFSGTEMEKR